MEAATSLAMEDTKDNTKLSLDALNSPPPFFQKLVQLTQAAYVELKSQVNYWKAHWERQKQRNDDLTTQLATAQAMIRDLKQRLYGKKSEKNTTQKDELMTSKAPATRPRGQQKGSQGHGRTLRPMLPTVKETLDVACEDKHCHDCGLPYTRLAKTEDSQIVEVYVKAHMRHIQRTIYVQACQCKGVPSLITAPPAPRLFPKSVVGLSVWTELLIQKFLLSRAAHNVCAEYTYRGLPLSLGTLTGGLKRMAALFQPLMDAWREKQCKEDLFHNDETGWKVFEATKGKVGYRWWLWVTQSPSVVYYTMAPSRGGDVPVDYFAGLDKHLERVVVVCDRYSGYKKLARKNTRVVLSFCWAHVRRDFLDAAKRWPKLQAWMLSWVEVIGSLYHANRQRLEQWSQDKALNAQTDAFDTQQTALIHIIDTMKKRWLHALNNANLHTAQRKVLNSLKNHWLGLIVFVQHPQVPMDNNTAERSLRNPAMGRKNYYGSGAQWSAELAATMFSVFQTLKLWQLNPHHWLYAYLSACADHGGKPPADVDVFIPWAMTEERRKALAKPLSLGADEKPVALVAQPP